MSERHEMPEAKEQKLRRDLADSIANKAAADKELAKAQANFDHGQRLLNTAQAELASLKSSQQTFRKKRTADHAAAVLAAIHGTEAITGPDEITVSPCPERIEAANLELSGCQAALDKLNGDLISAQNEAAHASTTVRELVDGIAPDQPVRIGGAGSHGCAATDRWSTGEHKQRRRAPDAQA